MFSKTVVSGISRLLIGSFLHLQLQSTVWAATQVIDLSVRPSEPSLPVPASQLFAYRQLQFKQEQENKEALEQLKKSLMALESLAQLSWTVNVVASVAEAAQTVTSVVFSPLLALQKLLEQSEAEIEQRLKQPLALHDLLEEKKLIDLGEGTSAEISWDGKVKISQTAKNSSELHVQSLTDVILDNVKISNLSINAPSVSLHGQADIDKLSIGFDGQGSSVFELGTDSVFRTQVLDLNGVLLNKGKIDLKDPAKVKAKSLVNLGTLHSEGTLSVEADHLFRNAGKLDASDLQLSAHIVDQVSLPGKGASQIKAKNISVIATENLNLKAGTLEGEQIALTSLGTFDNKSDVKAQRIQVTSHGEGVQDGVFQADVIDVASHATWLHRGTLTASQDMKFWIGESQVFEQQGVIQSPKVALAGEKSLFRNTRPLALQELHVAGPLQFENASPLTDEEAQGKEEPATQVTIGKFTGSTSSVTNTGCLTIKEGTLGTVHNRGIWTSDNLTVSDLRQSGRMKASNLSIEKNGLNEGELLLRTLEGQGSFRQSGNLASDQPSLQIGVETFTQKKDGALEPKTQAKEVHLTSPHVTLGENTHLDAENLQVGESRGPSRTKPTFIQISFRSHVH